MNCMCQRWLLGVALLVMVTTLVAVDPSRYLAVRQSSFALNQIEDLPDTVVYRSVEHHTLIHCSNMCLLDESCSSFFYSLSGYCQLHNVVLNGLTQPSAHPGSHYYIVNNDNTDINCGNATEVECHNLTMSGTKVGDTAVYTCLRTSPDVITVTQTCASDGFWTGETPDCECDCRDLFASGVTTSGVYAIHLLKKGRINIFCDMEQDGGGWSVIQRRDTDTGDFNRTMTDYRNTIGDVSSDYWFGLTPMNQLTPGEIVLSFHLQNGTEYVLRYSEFDVKPAGNNFTVVVSEYMTGSTWEDVFSEQNGQQFSAADYDQDTNEDVNCALQTGGGWWYRNCSSMSLNGVNAFIVQPSTGMSFSIAPPVVMKIRRVVT
ncbi:hypothetical protein ScPMuIL_017094 [Solemya velum]